MDPKVAKLLKLAHSFHVLRDAPGIAPWSPIELDAWGAREWQGLATKHAVAFILSIYDPFTNWSSGRFDMQAALLKWDSDNRAAFSSWAVSPWWC